jgi:hypothetical protein
MQEAGFARNPKLEPNSKSMMKTKLTLFVTVLAAALFGVGCASSSLVAYYPFDGNAKDESGNGNHGGVSGATLTLDRHGATDSAYLFDGIDDFVTIPHSENHISEKLTVSCWFLFDKLPSERSGMQCEIVCKPISGEPYQSYNMAIGGTTTGGPNDHFEGGHDPNAKAGNSGIGIRSTHVFNSSQKGTWYYGAYTYDGKVATLYLDGKAIGSKKEGGSPPSNLPLSIGSWGGKRMTPAGDSHAFSGKIDDVRIYNRALSAAEVKALYDLEKPKGK